MYIVSYFKNGDLSVPDAVVCSSIEELRESRDNGVFKRLFYPDCFYVDANAGRLKKMPAEFLKENVWKDEMSKRHRDLKSFCWGISVPQINCKSATKT